MTFFEAAKELGISSGLRRLPVEVIDSIYHYLKGSLFCRYITVLSFTQEVSEAAQKQGMFSFPLGQVLKWERGGQPALEIPAANLPFFIRLTIDARGIRQVEGLAQLPTATNAIQRYDDKAFVILEEGSLRGIIAHFKVPSIHP